jgi:hypothetical protein
MSTSRETPCITDTVICSYNDIRTANNYTKLSAPEEQNIAANGIYTRVRSIIRTVCCNSIHAPRNSNCGTPKFRRYFLVYVSTCAKRTKQDTCQIFFWSLQHSTCFRQQSRARNTVEEEENSQAKHTTGNASAIMWLAAYNALRQTALSANAREHQILVGL